MACTLKIIFFIKYRTYMKCYYSLTIVWYHLCKRLEQIQANERKNRWYMIGPHARGLLLCTLVSIVQQTKLNRVSTEVDRCLFFWGIENAEFEYNAICILDWKCVDNGVIWYSVQKKKMVVMKVNGQLIVKTSEKVNGMMWPHNFPQRKRIIVWKRMDAQCTYH